MENRENRTFRNTKIKGLSIIVLLHDIKERQNKNRNNC